MSLLTDNVISQVQSKDDASLHLMIYLIFATNQSVDNVTYWEKSLKH